MTRWQKFKGPLFAAFITLAVTAGAGAILAYAAHQREKARFESLADATASRIHGQLDLMASLLRGAAGLFTAEREITQNEFATYVTRLELSRRYPGVHVLVWLQRVEPEAIRDFVKRARERIDPQFHLWPEGEGTKYVVTLIEPTTPDRRQLLGLNAWAAPDLRETMEACLAAGSISFSGPLRLIVDYGPEILIEENERGLPSSGFLAYAPVFNGGGAGIIPDSLEERRERLKGFVSAGFRTEEFLAAVFAEEEALLQIRLSDREQGTREPMTIHWPTASDFAPRWRTQRNVEAWGRVWVLDLASRPEFEMRAGGGGVWLVAGLGIMFSLLAAHWSFHRQALMGELALSKAELVRANRDLEARVTERTAQLRQAATELINAEQRERSRIAEILHDDLQQILVSAKMFAGGAVAPEDQPRIDKVTELIDQGIQTARKLSQTLDPKILKEKGLAPGLESAARRAQESHGLEVGLELDPAAEPESLDVKIFLVRAVGEIFLNVTKHAGVDRAEMILRRVDEDWIEVIVADQGKGCDPEAVERAMAADHFGLYSVKSRLELLGGSFEMTSADGRGCKITLRVPVRNPNA